MSRSASPNATPWWRGRWTSGGGGRWPPPRRWPGAGAGSRRSRARPGWPRRRSATGSRNCAGRSRRRRPGASAGRAAGASRRPSATRPCWRTWSGWWSRRRAGTRSRRCAGRARVCASWRRRWATAGHRVSHQWVAEALRDLGYSLQGNRKTREGSANPDRDAQFAHINAAAAAALAAGEPVHLGGHQEEGTGRRLQERRAGVAAPGHAGGGAGARLRHPRTRPGAAPTASTTWRRTRAGSAWASTTTRPPSRWRRSAAGGRGPGRARYPGARRLTDHRRRRGQQRVAGAPVEVGIAAPGRRDRAGHPRLPPPARHQQVEQDRAPPRSPSSARTGAASRWSATPSSST